MLTVEQLDAMPQGTIFATGEIENSPEGIYMTNSDIGRKLRWVAKRGGIADWTIYCHWADSYSIQEVAEEGDKVPERDIRKLVPCTDEALKRFRR